MVVSLSEDLWFDPQNAGWRTLGQELVESHVLATGNRIQTWRSIVEYIHINLKYCSSSEITDVECLSFRGKTRLLYPPFIPNHLRGPSIKMFHFQKPAVYKTLLINISRSQPSPPAPL